MQSNTLRLRKTLAQEWSNGKREAIADLKQSGAQRNNLIDGAVACSQRKVA